MSDGGVEVQVSRIEGLIEAIEAGADGPARDAARELAAALIAFHGAGLARIYDRLAAAGAAGRAVAEGCARDELVAGMLALHELPRDPGPLVPLRRGRDADPIPAARPELSFAPIAAEAVPYAATPMIAIEVEARNGAEGVSVHAVLLRCQVRIEPARRGYGDGERGRLGDLFAADRPPGPILWTHAVAAAPAFEREARVSLSLPCTFDLAVASARYLDALEGGAAPLSLLFSGTVFLARGDGALTAEPIPWQAEARFDLPVAVWRRAIDLHYPGAAPLLLRRGVLDRLARHREARRMTSWEEAIEALLDAAGAP